MCLFPYLNTMNYNIRKKEDRNVFMFYKVFIASFVRNR